MFDFDTIVYHNPCNDGVASLWIANYYKEINEKIPCIAGLNPDFNPTNKNILFCDICPKFEYLYEISKIAKNIVILDHHKTTIDQYEKYKDACPNNLHVILDISKSGCQITWTYFFEKSKSPWFIDYIGDRDLWMWKLPNSKEINHYFIHHDMFNHKYLNNISKLLKYTNENINEIVKEGELLLKIRQKELDDSVDMAVQCSMQINNKIYNIWLGTTTFNNRSDLGNLLANKLLKNNELPVLPVLPDFSAIWSYEPTVNEWNISLRGNDNSPDLSNIAYNFGGGGHAKSAGFVIKPPNSLKDVFRCDKNSLQ